jgi:hypothetical protein
MERSLYSEALVIGLIRVKIWPRVGKYAFETGDLARPGKSDPEATSGFC